MPFRRSIASLSDDPPVPGSKLLCANGDSHQKVNIKTNDWNFSISTCKALIAVWQNAASEEKQIEKKGAKAQ